MKKLIGLVAFATIGLFGFTHEAPSAQADNGTLSSPLVDSELSAQEVAGRTCPATRPICCESDATGCLICISRTQQCP